jgi:hypothetical protein
MNYRIKTVHEENEFLWVVYETTSGLDIKHFYFEDDAETLAKHLNKGGGFSGWTPPFFLIDLSSYIDINEEFTGFFA